MYYIRAYIVSPWDNHLASALEQHGIGCLGIPPNAEKEGYRAMVFQVDESKTYFNIIAPFLPDVTPPAETEQSCLAELEDRHVTVNFMPCYTQEEIRSAQWLSMHAVTTKLSPINESTMRKGLCTCGKKKWGGDLGHHSVQAEPIVAAKPIRWKSMQFFDGGAGYDHIFCSDRAKTILGNSNLRDFRFEAVLKGKKKEILYDTYQLCSPHTVPDRAFFPVADMAESPCPQCGMQLLYFTGRRPIYGIRSDMLDPAIDFYETLPCFGAWSTLSCTKQYIISQRMYKFLIENRMTRGLAFTPLPSKK